MDKAQVYSDLKSRVATLSAQAQYWSGKKESHEASKKTLLVDAKAMGLVGETIPELKAALEKELSEELASLETMVAEAESQFNNLRSKYVTE